MHTGAVAMTTVLNVITMEDRDRRLSPLVTGEEASGRSAHAATAVLVAVADGTASLAQDTVQVLADATAAAVADRSPSSAGGEEEQVGCSRRLGFRAALMLISRGAWKTGLGG